MKSHVTKAFRRHLLGLPKDIRRQAIKSYKLWRDDPSHNSLQFKRVSQKRVVYSVRVGIGYRALGLVEAEEIYWFWIGPHGEYDTLLKRL